MLSINEPFLQEVIHENQQIYQRIHYELNNARSQILVATGWFTDHDLFAILLNKLDQGLDVRIILADNEDNNRLDFEKLREKGAAVYKVRKNGYGTMHKKFCIIDKRIAIHGSYNWSINARTNNQESVIVTTHKDTIASLVAQFTDMELEAAKFSEVGKKSWFSLKSIFSNKAKTTPLNSEADIAETSYTAEPVVATEEESPGRSDGKGNERLSFQQQYATVLDGMIAAELCNFDREMLRNQGYERAKISNGDPQVLYSAMDTVYSVFINDINVVEDKKKRLIGKINEQKIVYSNVLHNNYQTTLNTIEAQFESDKRETSLQISGLKTQAEMYEANISTIKGEKIIAAEKDGTEIEERIVQLDLTSVKPKFKWYEFIPILTLSLGILFYLFVFYSSAVYILLYSEAEAKEAVLKGVMPSPPQVFEPNALNGIMQKGGYAIGFTFLFVFIPLAISVISKLARNSIIGKPVFMFVLSFALDAFIAYKVSAAVYDIKILTGDVSEPWKPLMALKEPNFYLVFLLGSLGLWIFNALFNKFISIFEERNPDIRALQLKLQKEREKEILGRNNVRISLLKESVETYNRELIKIKNETLVVESRLAEFPNKRIQRLEQSALEFENNKKMLSDITVIYISHIENDILPISLDSMKDRINIFLEGWNGFLNDEYAAIKAQEKTKLAFDMVTMWQQEKLSGTRVNNRIKDLL